MSSLSIFRSRVIEQSIGSSVVASLFSFFFHVFSFCFSRRDGRDESFDSEFCAEREAGSYVKISSMLVSLDASTQEVVALGVVMLEMSFYWSAVLFPGNCLLSFLLVGWIGGLWALCLVGHYFCTCSLGLGRLLVGFFASLWAEFC